MKHIVALVNSNMQDRALVQDALQSFYDVDAYDNAARALPKLNVRQPKLIVVGQIVGESSGMSFLRDLQRDPALKKISVMFMLDNHDHRSVNSLREFGVNDYFVKPIEKSDLLKLITKNINSSTEKSWQELSKTQRKALEDTLNVFNGIAKDIANGNPISYDNTFKACATVVEAVAQGGLKALLHSIKDHDNLTYMHSVRFSALMALFGQSIGLPKEMQTLVASGGLLHDIGMMMIPRNLLTKQEKLHFKEMQMIKGHVAASASILARSEAIPKGVMTIVTQHHERLDGTGYPRGLVAKDLNELARMAGIIDVFCALTDRRPYRMTLSAHAALETMMTEMGGHLDLDLLAKFKDILLSAIAGEEESTELF